jgi:hypothetical protein
MAANEYNFATIWRVHSTPERVSKMLQDVCAFPRWWPDVYIEVNEIETGVYSLLTKGWLPYRLRWCAKEVESNYPYGFSIQAWGDLEGRGVWTFGPDGEYTEIRYDWTVIARKPILRFLSPLLKPVFEANHRWAMRRGEEAIHKQLSR